MKTYNLKLKRIQITRKTSNIPRPDHFGAAARTSLVHLSAYSLKLLLNKPASFFAVASNAAASRLFLAQANFGVKTSLGTPFTSFFGTRRPKIGIASHSESGSLPSVPS